MTGLDASFLYFENRTMHLHVVAAFVFDPSTIDGGYSFQKIKATVRERLHLVPQLRRRLATVPLNIGNPMWINDDDFDLDYHMRRIGCPSPGGEEEFAEIVGDIAGRPLDRSRPLWEMWIVEGLENGLIGAVVKMHHSTVDGVSGANLLVHFLDLEPNPPPKPLPEEEWRPERKPSALTLVGGALASRAARPMRLMRQMTTSTLRFGSLMFRRWVQRTPGMAMPLTAPRTSFNTTITSHRKVAFAHIPLEDVKAIKRTVGCTVNDVVLAVASGALRTYLEQGGEHPDRSLIACVPVSVRAGEDDSPGANKVSAMFTSLSTDVDDPLERLMRIHHANLGAKGEHGAIGANFLRGWGELAATNTFSLAARLYSAMHLSERHPVIHNLIISNVPGPPIPLYFAGAQLRALYPLGPIFPGAALNITVVSYLDTLYWGFHTSPEVMPRAWDLAHAVPEALAELRMAVDGVPAAAPGDRAAAEQARA
jgi:diacylglycerol O-acyltransferase / wax synthase